MSGQKICGVLLLIIAVLVLWFCATYDCDGTGGVFYAMIGIGMLLTKAESSDDEEWKE